MAMTAQLPFPPQPAQTDRPMPRHHHAGDCKVCSGRTRKAAEFCYVHEPYEGAPADVVQRARDSLQLERTREDRAAARERALVKMAPVDIEQEWRP